VAVVEVGFGAVGSGDVAWMGGCRRGCWEQGCGTVCGFLDGVGNQ
jgi:hypothetical protein